MQDEVGADVIADELAANHDESGGPEDVAFPDQEARGADVAGEVDGLGVGGGLGKFMSEQPDNRESPEGAGAGSEETIVETDQPAEEQSEDRDGHARGFDFLTELRIQVDVECHAHERPRDDQAEYAVTGMQEHPGAGDGGDESDDHRRPDFLPVDQAGSGVAPGGHHRADGALGFAGTEGELRGDANGEERRDADQSAAARDGINTSGRRRGEEQDDEGGG